MEHKHLVLVKAAEFFDQCGLADGAIHVEYLTCLQRVAQPVDVRLHICSNAGSDLYNGVQDTLEQRSFDGVEVSIFFAGDIARQGNVVVQLLKQREAASGCHGKLGKASCNEAAAKDGCKWGLCNVSRVGYCEVE